MSRDARNHIWSPEGPQPRKEGDPLRYPPKPGPENPDPEKNVPTKPDEDNDHTTPKPHTIDPIKPDPTRSPNTVRRRRERF